MLLVKLPPITRGAATLGAAALPPYQLVLEPAGAGIVLVEEACGDKCLAVPDDPPAILAGGDCWWKLLAIAAMAR